MRHFWFGLGLVLCLLGLFMPLLELFNLMPDRLSPATVGLEREDGQVAAVVRHIQTGEDAALRGVVPPALWEQLSPVLPALRDALPAAPVEQRLLSAHWGQNLAVTYELKGADGGYALLNIVLGRGEPARLLGIQVNPLKAPLAELNRFHLNGLSGEHYALLALMLVIVAVKLVALTLMWRCRVLRFRWLWTLFVCAGLGLVTMDWAGNLNLHLLMAGIMTEGFQKPVLYLPWSLKFALPVGAAIFLILRLIWREDQALARPLAPANTPLST